MISSILQFEAFLPCELVVTVCALSARAAHATGSVLSKSTSVPTSTIYEYGTSTGARALPIRKQI